MNRILWAAPIALAACATAPSQLATDAALIQTGVAVVAATLQAEPGVSAADKATITGIVTAVNVAVAGLPTDGKASASAIVSAVQRLQPIAAVYLRPGTQLAIALDAAVALLPVVLQAAGIVGAHPVAAHAMPVGMARGVLAGMK